MLLIIGCLPVSAFAEGSSAKITAHVNHQRTITIQPVSHGQVTVLAPDPLHDGDTVVFTMTPDVGYVLSAVYVNGVDVTKDVVDNTYTMTVAGDIEFRTVFESKGSGECVYVRHVCLMKNGTYGLKLGCCNKGEFTFTRNGCGWNIQNAEGKYLAMQDGRLKLSDKPFAWTYRNGTFSASVKTTQKTCGYWLGWIYIPGYTKTVTTTYYLSTVKDGERLSTCPVCAELYETVSGEHCFGCWIDCKNGTHKHICKNCGEVETEEHSYDKDTHKCVCGAYDPSVADVKISVDVKEKTTKQFSGFLFWGTRKNVTTYTATIKTEATGVKVTKVQYQVNGGKWMTGTSVSSDKPIETLKVKAWDNTGKLYEYTYTKSN